MNFLGSSISPKIYGAIEFSYPSIIVSCFLYKIKKFNKLDSVTDLRNVCDLRNETRKIKKTSKGFQKLVSSAVGHHNVSAPLFPMLKIFYDIPNLLIFFYIIMLFFRICKYYYEFISVRLIF